MQCLSAPQSSDCLSSEHFYEVGKCCVAHYTDGGVKHGETVYQIFKGTEVPKQAYRYLKGFSEMAKYLTPMVTPSLVEQGIEPHRF